MRNFSVHSRLEKCRTNAPVDIHEEKKSSVQNAKQFNYEELEVATENFKPDNKIGEGGFGSVYKGKLNDGTLVAIKILCTWSEQGVSEFLKEIEMLSQLNHTNLVKLYGSCTNGSRRMLVYEYLENNSLAQMFLGGHYNKYQFSWKIRFQICVGVAQVLAFLHESVEPCIVHGDIKPSNILLDKDFTPKISDFGLARLFPTSMTRINIRVAGTFGYLAPEYVLTGIMTWKSDVYSFGILLLEIICGRPIGSTRLPVEEQNLLARAWLMYKRDKLDQLVDKALEGDCNIEKACKCLKIGLLCVQERPAKRPDMSVVAKMLKGEIDVDKMKMPKPGKLMSQKMRPGKSLVLLALKSSALLLGSCCAFDKLKTY